MNNGGNNQGPPPYGPIAGEPTDTEPPPKYELPADGPYAQAPVQGGYYPPPAGAQTTGYHPAPNLGQPAEGQPAYPAQAQPGYGTVHQTVIIRDAGFGPQPRTLDCPNCHSLISTETEHVTGGLTWLSAGLICLFGCWLGCCLIPFCVPEMQDVKHKCPNCGCHVGTYSRL